MATKKAYKKALRAAKSVVAGRKQGTGAALAGLALVAYLPGCYGSTFDPEPVDSGSEVTTLLDTSNSDVQQLLSDIHDMLSTDGPMASDKAAPLPEVASADEGPAPSDEGKAPTDEGPSPTDEAGVPTDKGPAEDVADQGWISPFPDSCLQATGTSCDNVADCEVTSASCEEGACMAGATSYVPTAQSCAGPDECGETELCMSNQCHELSEEALVASECCADVIDPEIGCMQPTDIPCTDEKDCEDFNGMACIDDLCHAGQLTNHPVSVHVDTCCFASYDVKGCGFMLPMGCYPWGPPAPPAYNGVRLKELLQTEVA